MSWFRGGAALVTVAVAGFAAQTAAASGGTNVASAPSIVYRQQEFGNTVTDNGESPGEPVSFHLDAGCANGNSSWWTLSVQAGDKVTIDFEGGASTMLVYRVGTTDFNLLSTDSFLESDMPNNDKQEATFSTPASGSMPVDFYDCADQPAPGPYDFTASVLHGLVVSLNVGAVNHRKHRTAFVVALHSPSGGGVSNPALRSDVQILAHGRWVTLRTIGAPYAFSDRWSQRQRGNRQSLRVRVHGPGYQTTISRTVRVTAV
jgi:hypothetical protein